MLREGRPIQIRCRAHASLPHFKDFVLFVDLLIDRDRYGFEAADFSRQSTDHLLIFLLRLIRTGLFERVSPGAHLSFERV
jgi:hypothetical protein